MTPISGPITTSPATHGTDYVQTFSHANEQASPGSYAMTTDAGVKTELTATRGGVGRFTFPTDKVGTLLLNVTGSINGVDDAEATVKGQHRLRAGPRPAASAARDSRYYVYFSATFDRPFQTYGTWKDDGSSPGGRRTWPRAAKVSQPSQGLRPPAQRPGRKAAHQQDHEAEPRDVSVKGPGSGVYLQFDTSRNQPVQMRTGRVVRERGRRRGNLATEIGGKDYDAVRGTAAHRLWADRLGQIKVERRARRR